MGGFDRDIAFYELLKLFDNSSEFKKDEASLQTTFTNTSQTDLPQPPLHPKGISLEFPNDLIQNRALYTALTNKFIGVWRDCTDSVLKNKAETVATKWGLRCEWGYGLVLSGSASYYPALFTVTPGPLGSQKTYNITVSRMYLKEVSL